jgi:hypothetical protein
VEVELVAPFWGLVGKDHAWRGRKEELEVQMSTGAPNTHAHTYKAEPVFLSLFSAVLGFELRACILSHSTSPFFVMGFSEMGSLELFAQAGFELPASCSLPPE